jgi:hypothetical protein
MPKRLRKPPSDPIQAAHSIFAQLTGEEPRLLPPEKNAAAVELGRLGGAKGGKKRAAGMTAEERKESARKAAAARWRKLKD